MQNALVGQRGFGIDHWIERLVLDLHELRSVIGQAGRFGHNRHNRLALIAYFGDGQGIVFDATAGIRTDLNEWPGLRRDLSPGERAEDTGKGQRARDINADNLGVSIGRAYESQIKHLAQLDVVGKLAAPA